jgi:hypothetical protein
MFSCSWLELSTLYELSFMIENFCVKFFARGDQKYICPSETCLFYCAILCYMLKLITRDNNIYRKTHNVAKTITYNHNMYLHLCISLPKTELSSSIVEQFQRSYLNCFWHCSSPSFAPFPILFITSGFCRQSVRCVPTRPTTLLHMTFAPREYTFDIYLKTCQVFMLTVHR